MTTTINQLQKFLHHEIPLTKAMGMQLIDFDTNSIITKAPLEENINDKGSVFGGASSALMIITGWSLIKLSCEEHDIDADIVIHKNETLWQKAMYEELKINARYQLDYDFQEIKTMVDSGRHKRIACLIELVGANNKLFSTMKAKYVIINREQNIGNNNIGAT